VVECDLISCEICVLLLTGGVINLVLVSRVALVNLVAMCVLFADCYTFLEGMARQAPPASSVQTRVKANDMEADNPLTVVTVGPEPAGTVEELQEALLGGWRQESTSTSLEECNSRLRVPEDGAAWWKQWAAYVGVGFLVAVG